jgi:hypothetical protein
MVRGEGGRRDKGSIDDNRGGFLPASLSETPTPNWCAESVPSHRRGTRNAYAYSRAKDLINCTRREVWMAWGAQVGTFGRLGKDKSTSK